mmetsp:Transcript_6941/g.42378  ORF Transcript_6941/g.42378 Transcript_6941/m.42378 type:complete len:360 (-) Transcript_6941:6645-7724(-)
MLARSRVLLVALSTACPSSCISLRLRSSLLGRAWRDAFLCQQLAMQLLLLFLSPNPDGSLHVHVDDCFLAMLFSMIRDLISLEQPRWISICVSLVAVPLGFDPSRSCLVSKQCDKDPSHVSCTRLVRSISPHACNHASTSRHTRIAEPSFVSCAILGRRQHGQGSAAGSVQGTDATISRTFGRIRVASSRIHPQRAAVPSTVPSHVCSGGCGSIGIQQRILGAETSSRRLLLRARRASRRSLLVHPRSRRWIVGRRRSVETREEKERKRSGTSGSRRHLASGACAAETRSRIRRGTRRIEDDRAFCALSLASRSRCCISSSTRGRSREPSCAHPCHAVDGRESPTSLGRPSQRRNGLDR